MALPAAEVQTSRNAKLSPRNRRRSNLMKLKSQLLIAGVLVIGIASSSFAQGQEDKGDRNRKAASGTVQRLDEAANVLNDIMNVPDKGIPEGILASAKCVAVVPSLIKGGFIVGGHYGRGVATCRNKSAWSGPAPFTITGGSWGLQFGGEEVDLLLIVMNDRGMNDFLATKCQLGTASSVAAGPVGRIREASPERKAESEVLSYVRARGVFAGLDLNGAVIEPDADALRDLYGRVVPSRTVLLGKVPPPKPTRHFLAVVDKWATPTPPASRPPGEPLAEAWREKIDQASIAQEVKPQLR